MDLGLRGKVAIVGGASQGIGFAIARELAREGASVTITARKQERLFEARDRLTAETGASILAVPGDWTRAADNERAVEETLSQYGRLDVLVNNDGAPPLGELVGFDDAAWTRAIERNFLSAVRLSRLVVPHMRAAGAGRIVNVTATSAKEPIPRYGLSVATWAGLIGYAKTLSRELGPEGITVNTILPGRINTERLETVLRYEAEVSGRAYEEMVRADLERIPVGHAGAPEDVAGVVAFLVSERGRFITGTAIPVDGGTVRGMF
ncbi:MAG TPA: SDR family oxidoreductase [Candidatus Dormibacteraeota bacterium]|nr:SDR family oxidoreductase [Candidatus Dormibacteraeota bacterium]